MKVQPDFQRFARLVAALVVAILVLWPVLQNGNFIGLPLISLVCYWGLFAALFDIGAARKRRLGPTLAVGIVLAIVAPFVASLAQRRLDDTLSYGWVGLSVIFMIAAIVAAVYRRRESDGV